MEYQKTKNMLDNTSNQSYKFWIQITDDSHGAYNNNS